MKFLVITAWTAVLMCLRPMAGSADTIWVMGVPDGMVREFGLVEEGYGAFNRRFPRPVEFVVGTSTARDWPFIHPAPRDRWAGGREHPFTIRFGVEEVPADPVYLVLGLAGAHSSERSRVEIGLNGTVLPVQVAPAGEMHLAFDPNGRGTPQAMVFPLPAGGLAAGENRLTITLKDESWVLYDYVALRRVGEPVPVVLPDIRRALLEGPMREVEEVVFAVRRIGSDSHWYANIGYYADWELDQPHYEPYFEDGRRVTWRPGGRLGRLNVRSGEVTWLLDDPAGGVRDPVVHYDGQTILFSYRRGGSGHYHLYTIRADGTGLRQLTDGGFDDFEPCWLPNDDIVFVSTRARRWVNCWVTEVATLHRCRPDGTGIRAISANNEHDNTPWVLPDGRVLYQRWEYVDRSQVDYHHLWTTNPDGTGQMVYYGNQQPGIVMIGAKPIPGSHEVIAIFSPGHGIAEHAGSVAVVSPDGGPDDPAFSRYVNRATDFRDPWAFAPDAFMVARGAEIQLMDGTGLTARLYRLPELDVNARLTVHEPRPLLPREREPILPDAARPGESTGRVILANVYEGRRMEDVQPGEIRKLLVLETLPKPINFTGGMDPLTYGGSFTLERILGTVPVEADGSAYVELPAMRGLFFVALDENDLAVKRMQSFLTVQPGETTSCVGCHEQRTRSYVAAQPLLALQRPARRPEPIPDTPDVFDFPRDIQPILDRLCLDCHDTEPTSRGGPQAGGVLLSGDHGPMFSHGYFTMTVRRLFRDGRNEPQSNYAPRAIGSAASRILEMVNGAHHGVQATERERRWLRLWIEVGAPYPGTYGALGSGSIGGYAENQKVHTDFDWPTTRAGAAVIEARCASCHQGNDRLPHALADEKGVSFWRFDLDDPRLKLSRHIVFNLSRPERSLLLLAPLGTAHGGLGRCRNATDEPVFASREDPGYQILLGMVTAGREYLAQMKRFDMPGFRPRTPYLRELQRYGIVPVDLAADAPVDPYALDRAYWESLWHQPSAGGW